MGNDIVRVEIELENGEPIEKALRRFRKASNACGHLRILRNRKTFECAHDKKIRKNKESAMRLARARRSARSRAAARSRSRRSGACALLSARCTWSAFFVCVVRV